MRLVQCVCLHLDMRETAPEVKRKSEERCYDHLMRVVPMIHVPDVGATVRWYATLGFNPIRQNEEDGEVNWALLSSGETELMFSAGGKLTTDSRREVDLYVHTEGVDEMHERLKDRVQVVEEPHDTFYGMREIGVHEPSGHIVVFAART